MFNKYEVRIEKLYKTYKIGKVEVKALNDINLNAISGEFIAIMGPSGSGKTTLLNIIGGLDKPSEGKAYLKEVDLASLNETKLAEFRCLEVGFIFQTYNLIPILTALENVQLPTVAAGLPSKEGKKRAINLLERVGLKDRSHHKPTELSGGEQQRVAIARALVNRPSILLADEITGNVDSATGLEIVKLISELNREHHMTVIAATHDSAVAQQAKRVIKLRDGKIET